MDNFDDKNKIQEIDKQGMLGSIELLPDQCQQAYNEVQSISIPDNYKSCRNIVISAMGGSGLGPHLFSSLFFDVLKVPVTIVNGYHLPEFANEETLVLLSSYSGTTEETLSCGKEALNRKSKIMGITTGGLLSQFLIENKLPGYIFTPQFNPCNQPRMGIGYSVLSVISLFNKCGLLNISKKEIKETIDYMRSEKDKLNEVAKLLVPSLRDKIPIVISADFLAANAHILSNQLNENSKNFSSYFLIPELNHHLLEGFFHPQAVQSLTTIFLNSNLYEEKISKRLNLTKEIISKNNVSVFEFKPDGKTRLAQVLSTLIFSSFVSFYLSMLYDQDPSLIPWVDYFKEQLKKSQ